MNPTQPNLPNSEQAAPLQPQASDYYQPVASTMPVPPVAGAPYRQAPAAPTSAAGAGWLPPSVPVQPASDATTAPAASGGAASVPSVADDGDLIEKEWVMHAKQIVDHSRQDPYKQTKELHKLKAEYMKKRYNKIIEPVEE